MRTLSLKHVVQIGTADLARMALAGELSRSQLWTACSGARKYVEAMARGDIAPDEAQHTRGACCLRCPNAWREGTAVGTKVYCGPKLIEDPANGRCGCLLGVEDETGFVPGGKLGVKSEECWAGIWHAA